MSQILCAALDLTTSHLTWRGTPYIRYGTVHISNSTPVNYIVTGPLHGHSDGQLWFESSHPIGISPSPTRAVRLWGSPFLVYNGWRLKRSQRKADRSPWSSASVKNAYWQPSLWKLSRCGKHQTTLIPSNTTPAYLKSNYAFTWTPRVSALLQAILRHVSTYIL